jgi:Ca2+-binding EF-hand superfamily protein
MSEEATRTFKEFDRDGDGYIDTTEFKLAMGARGEEISDADVASIFKSADAHDGDADRRISLAEFIVAWGE